MRRWPPAAGRRAGRGARRGRHGARTGARPAGAGGRHPVHAGRAARRADRRPAHAQARVAAGHVLQHRQPDGRLQNWFVQQLSWGSHGSSFCGEAMVK